MRSFFDPLADYNRHRRIRATRHDVGALVNVSGIVHWFDFETVLLRDFPRIRISVGLGRTIDLDLFDFAREQKRLNMGTGHAARADHSDDLGILSRHVLGTDAGVRADPHMLQVAIIDERQRLAVLDAGQENQAAKSTGTHAVFFLRDRPLIFLFVDHVRLHSYGEVAGYGTAFHRPPLIDPFLVLGGNLNVDARAADRFFARQFTVSFVESFHGDFHSKNVLDVFVV